MSGRAWFAIVAALALALLPAPAASAADQSARGEKSFFVGNGTGKKKPKREARISFAVTAGETGSIATYMPHTPCEDRHSDPLGRVSFHAFFGPAEVDQSGTFTDVRTFGRKPVPTAVGSVEGEIGEGDAKGTLSYAAWLGKRPGAASGPGRKYCSAGRIFWRAERVTYREWKDFRRTEQGIR